MVARIGKTFCNSMWLPWLHLMVLGLNLIPATIGTVTTALEDVDGEDPNAEYPARPDQTTVMPPAVPHHDRLSGSMVLAGITHGAHGQGASIGGGEGEGNQEDAGCSQGKDHAPRRKGSSIEHSDGTKAASCFTVAALGEALSALHTGQSREHAFGQDTLAKFGICSGKHGVAGDSAGLSALSTLVAARDGNDVGPCGSHLYRECWVPGEEAGSVSLTFEVPVAFEGSEHLSAAAPTLLLFFVAYKGKEMLEVTFNSETLLPNTQAACLSEGSQFIILTTRLSELERPRLQTVQLAVKSKQPSNGPRLSLLEVQDVLIRGGGKEADSQRRPLLVFVSKRPPYKDKPGNNSLNPTDHRTYEFLCELQKFLSDVLPGKEGDTTPPPPHLHLSSLSSSPPPPPPPPPSLQLSNLSSLPPLVLDAYSSESLLSGLLSSSSPVLFSFPQQCSELRGHRVALSLQRPLLSKLREQLDDVLMRFQSEEVEKGVMERVQVLRALSVLPAEEVTRPEGAGKASEEQYRALLLLKTLQTVLGVREANRAQRPARAGDESLGQSNACRLHSLTVNLEAFFVEPSEAVINNCQGECGFPLLNGNSHAMLLNRLAQSGDWAGRAPCCVPTEYGVLPVYEIDGDGTKISTKTNIVALECGCR